MSNKKLGPRSAAISLQVPNKPRMPNSTPAPGPNGRLNAYSSTSAQYYGTQSTIYDTPSVYNPKKSATKSKATIMSDDYTLTGVSSHAKEQKKGKRTKRPSVESAHSQGSILSQTSSMNSSLTDIVRDLPFDDREKVTSLVNMAIYSSECFQKESHAIGIELKSLKASYRVKHAELHTVEKECEVYQSQIASMEDKLNTLEDDAESKQNYALRNSKVISRLSSTNKTLIDAFALIHEETPKTKAAGSIPQQSECNATSGIKLSPIGRGGNTINVRKKERKTNPNTIDPYEGTPVTSNEKLRERLLRVAKEHNRVEKNCEGLESKIMGLRSSLRVAERRNRQLQLELDELNEHINSEGKHPRLHLLAAASFCTTLKTDIVKTENKRKQKRVPMTNRLDALVSRNAFDATDGIKQIDALISHLAHTPSTLIEADIARHLCTRFACRLFDSEGMILFILQPGGKVMHRYATGSENAVLLDMGEHPSIAENTMRTGLMRRYNNNIRNNSFFHPDIDGIDTVNAKRVLTFPLRNQDKTLVIGVMHLLNKRNNNKFTEVDELYGSAFSDVVGSFFSSSILFKRLWLESDTLCGILRASRMLVESLPPVTSIVATRPLLPEEVLYALEHVVRNSLKCSQAKAFLLSKHCGEQEECFITLEKSSIAMMTLKPEHLACHKLPIHSGIAGHVALTKTAYLVSDPSADALFNTQIDIALECETFYCVPILNMMREVIAIIQVAPSALSPKLKSSKEMGDSSLAFENAIDWLLYGLSDDFLFMVKSIGSPLARPDIQYLEPITLTEKIATMHISLEAAPLEEESIESTTIQLAESSPVESGRPRSRTMDEGDSVEDFEVGDYNGGSDEIDEKNRDFADEDSAGHQQTGDYAEKYERQILALEEEIRALTLQLSSDTSDAETQESKEEEMRVRKVLRDEYTVKFETDLVNMKNGMKRRHDSEENTKKIEVDSDLVLLRERVAKMIVDNESAEVETREEENRKHVELSKIIESLQNQDVAVTTTFSDPHLLQSNNDNVVVKREVAEVIQESSVSASTPSDQQVLRPPSPAQAPRASSARSVRSTRSNAEHPSPSLRLTSARSNKSTRSEIPPTPTKKEVEASPRIGDWMEAFDPDGYKYYYNTATEESSWEKPSGYIDIVAVDDTYEEVDVTDKDEENDVVRIGEWTQAMTEDGHTYWVHDITGESTWDTPSEDPSGGSLLYGHSPKGHSQSAPVLSQYAGNSKVTAGDYSIEL